MGELCEGGPGGDISRWKLAKRLQCSNQHTCLSSRWSLWRRAAADSHHSPRAASQLDILPGSHSIDFPAGRSPSNSYISESCVIWKHGPAEGARLEELAQGTNIWVCPLFCSQIPQRVGVIESNRIDGQTRKSVRICDVCDLGDAPPGNRTPEVSRPIAQAWEKGLKGLQPGQGLIVCSQ